MKHLARRSLALLLCLALLVGVLPAVVFAQVNYVEEVGKIFNWGSRGTVATFLSPNAEKFYQKNNTSYDQLASLGGSSNQSSVPQTALYLQLQSLMTQNHKYKTSYDATKSLYQYTDCQNSGGAISSFYSGKSIGPAWDGTWNREHTWPNSKGLDGKDENDIMMLRPTSVSENSSRGNTAYGESASFYDPNNESGGKLNLHGDVARIMLYTYVRWGNTEKMWGSSGVMESREVLLKWLQEDPVDTWELGRNDAVESITGTRNVFVDYPELAFIMLGAAVPTNMVTPSGEALSSGNYTITAVSSDEEMGLVSLNGNVITAQAAEGFRVTGYTVTEGNAIVNRSGDTFTVKASSDCTIRIDFALAQTVTVSFVQNGSPVTSAEAYAGDPVVLPAYSGAVPEDYTFRGWVTDSVNRAEQAPAKVYAPGSSLTVTENTTVYALYSWREDDGAQTGSVYEAYSGELVEGDYLIVVNDQAAAMKAAEVDGPRLDYASITVTDGAITKPDELLVWHIAPTPDGYVTMYNQSAGKYASSSGTKNQAILADADTVSDNIKWSVTITNGRYDFENVANAAAGINANLRKNSTYGFACYSPASGYALLNLYQYASGTVYYGTTCGKQEVTTLIGDVNLDGNVDRDDVLTLMWYVLFPDEYSIEVEADYDKNGSTDVDDAITLLWYVLSPEEHPLN